MVSSSARSPALRLLLLVLLVFVVYSPCLRGEFIWDDRGIESNVLLRTPQGLAQIWTEPRLNPYEAHYWPVTYTALWLMYQAWGLEPAGYHIVSDLVHALNAWLVLLVLRRLRVHGSWMAALLFAVHPVHVESVAWIIQIKTLLSTCLGLLSFLAFLEWTESGRLRWWWAALAGYVLSLLAKTATLPLPLVMMLVLAWRPPAALSRRAAWGGTALLLLAGGALALADTKYARSVEKLPPDLRSLLERAAMASHLVWEYLGKLVCPVRLGPFYGSWTFRAETSDWMALAVLSAAAGGLVWLAWRRPASGRPMLVAAASYVLLLAPVLGFVRFAYQLNYAPVADRFQYAASIPVLAALSAGGTLLLRRRIRKPLRRLVAGLVVGILGAVTAQQTLVWKDNARFWAVGFRQRPDLPGVLVNYALVVQKEGQIGRSYELLSRAVRIDPYFPMAHLHLGNVLSIMGRKEEAERSYREAIRLQPEIAVFHSSLGRLLQSRGDHRAAEESYREALRLQPGYIAAHLNLADALREQGRTDEAREVLERARRLAPDDPRLSAPSGA